MSGPVARIAHRETVAIAAVMSLLPVTDRRGNIIPITWGVSSLILLASTYLHSVLHQRELIVTTRLTEVALLYRFVDADFGDRRPPASRAALCERACQYSA